MAQTYRILFSNCKKYVFSPGLSRQSCSMKLTYAINLEKGQTTATCYSSRGQSNYVMHVQNEFPG